MKLLTYTGICLNRYFMRYETWYQGKLIAWVDAFEYDPAKGLLKEYYDEVLFQSFLQAPFRRI